MTNASKVIVLTQVFEVGTEEEEWAKYLAEEEEELKYYAELAEEKKLQAERAQANLQVQW